MTGNGEIRGQGGVTVDQDAPLSDLEKIQSLDRAADTNRKGKGISSDAGVRGARS